SLATRDGIWRCAMPMAPHQLPSLPPPNRANPPGRANSRLDKTWGQGQNEFPLGKFCRNAIVERDPASQLTQDCRNIHYQSCPHSVRSDGTQNGRANSILIKVNRLAP